jgi:hypothetical protein
MGAGMTGWQWIWAILAVACAIAPADARPDPASQSLEGSRQFVARPTLGKAKLQLPSEFRWRAVADGQGKHTVSVSAWVDVASVLSNIQTLSAKALDRSSPCGDTIRVESAAAKLIGKTSLAYDLRFHYGKKICAGGLPLELPATVACAARIALSASQALIAIDVRGATTPPCQIEGAHQSVSEAIYAMVGTDVFQRHVIDLARILPREFQGLSINIRALAFDLPPARARLRIAGDSVMSHAQLASFLTRVTAVAPTTQ